MVEPVKVDVIDIVVVLIVLPESVEIPPCPITMVEIEAVDVLIVLPIRVDAVTPFI